MAGTPICTVDDTGIHKPDLAACLAYFTNGYQGIYGADTYLGSDSQDGELMGLLGSAVDDCNTETVASYNSYRPTGAQGTGLSSMVKINGLERKTPTNSQAPCLIGGTFGTTIPAGIVADSNGNQWALPLNTVIPISGQITVTATAVVAGATASQPQSVQIKTQTLGWQTAAFTSAASPGQPVETDPQLRTRQAASTTQPAQSNLENVAAAVLPISGVTRLLPYENDTDLVDANGVPGNTISIVVDGGDALAIATAIKTAKSGGCGTYGSTTETIVDQWGVPHAINFFYVSEPPITWGVTINPLNGFSLNTVALIQQSLSDWTNSLGIWCGNISAGSGIELTRAYAAAYLTTSIQAAVAALDGAAASGDIATIQATMASINAMNAAAGTYEITALTVAKNGGSLSTADVPIAFYEAPACVPTAVAVTVV